MSANDRHLPSLAYSLVHREEIHHRLQDFNDCPEVADQNEHDVGWELRSDSAAQKKQGET
jgi:hypothetical protein